MKNYLCVLAIFTCGCTDNRQATCEESADAYRPDDFSMIVTKPSKSVYDFNLRGISPTTGKSTYFKSKNYTWALDFNEFILVGDTVYKKKGELNFYIHKKDTLLVFPLECEYETYQ